MDYYTRLLDSSKNRHTIDLKALSDMLSIEPKKQGWYLDNETGDHVLFYNGMEIEREINKTTDTNDEDKR